MDAQVKRIVWNQIASLANDTRVYVGAEINEGAWITLLTEQMEEQQPVAHRAVLYEAPKDFYAATLKEFIRKTREPAVEDALDLRESMKRAAEQKTVVKFKLGRDFKAKRYIDLTPGEALALASEYRKQGGALFRKAAQYEADANHAIQLGLALDRPFATLFTEEDLQGGADDVAAAG